MMNGMETVVACSIHFHSRPSCYVLAANMDRIYFSNSYNLSLLSVFICIQVKKCVTTVL
jgi:hypothetical protein